MTIAQPRPSAALESLIAGAIGATHRAPIPAPAPTARPVVVCHIRREDECTITYCDRLTALDPTPAATAPIAMASGRDVAVYADVEWAGRPCTRCRDAYYVAYEGAPAAAAG